ncbi:hypothetical protein NPA07_02875 [Mycoplasmopsis caviae]|uniref:Uncharacterized protein n=1 Tax=Mycoplasmopsis caviae TaxID=55603 RepID=A0A3P8KNG6_9BACT|nr:hypothetical protein [Mycoplasmopsis caviae]UUD34743.1 hypothetical protein NPA07_02875 [Mycoplasmopsis caviae]VDR42438.1 Uncharacterised protein [Mycoplasmopsis caviae]
MTIHIDKCHCPACMINFHIQEVEKVDNSAQVWPAVLITIALVILISITIYLAIKFKKVDYKK